MWLDGLLKTLQDQTYRPRKVILVDDHSALPLQESLAGSRFDINVLVHLAKGRGLSNARNEGIDLCGTKYIAFIDVDDRWDREKLKMQVNFLESNSEIDAVFTNASTVDMEGTILRNHVSAVNEVYTEGLVLEQTPIIGSASSIMIRRESVSRTGYFDTKLNYAEDLDYWIRISKIGRIMSIPDILTFITANPESMQRGISPFEKYSKEIVAKLEIFEKHPDSTTQAIENLSRTLLYGITEKTITLSCKYKLFNIILNSKILKGRENRLKFIFHFGKSFAKVILRRMRRYLILVFLVPAHFIKKSAVTFLFIVKIKK